jgi:hypothetical protein
LLRNSGLDLVSRYERRKESLPLGDLRHLGRRRETFERRREHRVRFDGAVGRLIEFRQRERRLQFEASRLLRLCDGDGGAEGLFGRHRVRAIALEQDCAADAVEQGVGPVLTGLIRERQRFVDPAQGSVRVIPLGFELGEPALEERDKQLVSLAEICRQRFSETGHRAFAIAEPDARPI